jgi:hypothetical protein
LNGRTASGRKSSTTRRGVCWMTIHWTLFWRMDVCYCDGMIWRGRMDFEDKSTTRNIFLFRELNWDFYAVAFCLLSVTFEFGEFRHSLLSTILGRFSATTNSSSVRCGQSVPYRFRHHDRAPPGIYDGNHWQYVGMLFLIVLVCGFSFSFILVRLWVTFVLVLDEHKPALPLDWEKRREDIGNYTSKLAPIPYVSKVAKTDGMPVSYFLFPFFFPFFFPLTY